MVELSRLVQGGDDLLVIAEAGVNHNGDVELAHRLIDVAAASGAGTVKFQTFTVEKLVAPNADSTPYQKQQGATSQSELLRALALPVSAWAELRDHALEAGIGFMSTPFDLDSAEFLVELGVDALKIPSGELTNIPFIAAVANMGLPLLLSTGMGELDEIAEALDATSSAPSTGLFHCVSAYPAPREDCNLRAIPEMHRRFDRIVGWSDHTLGADSAVAASALGARLFEKHFTLDRSLPGPDHQASLTPDELRDYVDRITDTVTMLGDGTKRRMPSEQENAPLVRRSWHATRDLASGAVLTSDDMIALRPEAGVRPSRTIVGERLVRAVRAHEPFLDDHFA